jgi:cobalt-zinc-cadmium efflux system outer membrane protein
MAGFSQPIEWPAKRAARQRAAEAGLAGASVGLIETRLNLTADVKVAFYDLLLAQRDLELAKNNLNIVEDVRRIVGVRVRLGEAPQFDLIKAEVEVLKANQAVTRAENTVRVNRVILDTLTAGALGQAYNVSGDFVVFPAGLELQLLATRSMREHPSIQRLARSIDQADRTVEFERQARVPNVNLTTSYAREYGREGFDAGLSLPMPIWYQRQGEIAGSLGAKRREEAELLRMRNELLRQVNQYFQDAQTTAKLIEVLEKGLLRQAEEALRIAKFSFQQGAASLLEVLDAQRVQRQTLFDYAQARFELSVALAKLERAVGGLL